MGDGVLPPTVADVLADRVARSGSLRFDEFVELALYHPDGGFFASGGGAGRRTGDFITSPEVGPLFGAVVARYLDSRWEDLGRPDPFVVVEAAAGRGALALAVLAAGPACAPALRYVLVERSAALRSAQSEHLALSHPSVVLGPEPDPDDDDPPPSPVGDGPVLCQLADLPSVPVTGVVLANELLDNVAFRLLQRDEDGWSEVRVTAAGDDAAPRGSLRFVELLVPADAQSAATAEELAPRAAPGSRIPLQGGASDWLARALSVVRSGSVLAIDYAVATTAELAGRPWGEWVRTYRAHERGVDPLHEPGSQDITCDVAVDQLARLAPVGSEETQADWLRRWGIDVLVEEGRRTWSERAGVADLAAIRARSRVVEAEALCDPAGLGAHRVVEWQTR